MELKTARLTLLIDPNKKAAFERLCARQDRTASQVVRQLVRDYLVAHGVEDSAPVPEGALAAPADARRHAASPSQAASASEQAGHAALTPAFTPASKPAARTGARRR